MRDKTLGILLVITSVFVMIGYFWLLFLSPPDWRLLGKTPSEWAVIIPILIIVYGVLFILAWIGQTMATTSPPLDVIEK